MFWFGVLRRAKAVPQTAGQLPVGLFAVEKRRPIAGFCDRSHMISIYV